MRKRNEKILWGAYLCALVLLFLLSSTDLIIKEKVQEVYPISVIIAEENDNNYVNFKKGMDHAAIELNADVSFVTLYESQQKEQQKELILREQQEGARALILVPVEEQDVTRMIADRQITVPLVIYQSDLTGTGIAGTFSPDYVAMGQMLAEQIAAKYRPEIPVYLAGGSLQSRTELELERGLRAVLEPAGFLCTTGQDPLAYESFSEPSVIVSLNPQRLGSMAAALEENSRLSARIQGLYGIGSSVQLLNYLDRGVIDGLCVTDDFGAGYLTVRRAVEAVVKNRNETTVELESYYIEREDIHQPEYEKMLYPVE